VVCPYNVQAVLTLQAIVCLAACVHTVRGGAPYIYRPPCDASISTLTTPGPRALAPGAAVGLAYLSPSHSVGALGLSP